MSKMSWVRRLSLAATIVCGTVGLMHAVAGNLWWALFNFALAGLNLVFFMNED